MKYLIKIILLIVIIFGCKNTTNKNTETKNETLISISYEDGLKNCDKIKADNPDDYHFQLDDCIVGSTIPEFKATTTDGIMIDSENLKGKVTVINFWFTTCPPCVAELPGLNQIVDKFGRDKVNFISIARNSREEVEEFLLEHPLYFTHISNEDNIIEGVFKLPFGFPTTYLLDQDNRIIKSFSGGAMGEEAITQIQGKLIPAIENAL